MICPNCKNEIKESAKFCPFCGEKNFTLKIASSNRRFINLLLDNIFSLFFIYVTAFLLGYILAILGLIDENVEISSSVDKLLLYTLWICYYIFFEAVFGRTIAKFITGTKVVAESGGKPDFNQIFKRSLIRLIPFEAFSFYGKNPIGWHDKWSKTRVVKI